MRWRQRNTVLSPTARRLWRRTLFNVCAAAATIAADVSVAAAAAVAVTATTTTPRDLAKRKE